MGIRSTILAGDSPPLGNVASTLIRQGKPTPATTVNP